MKAIKIVVFVLFLYAAAAWGGEGEEPTLQGVYFYDHIEYPTGMPVPEILSILRECLTYIPDSSVIYNDSADSDNYLANGTLAIYRFRSAQTDADETADEAQAQANRVRDMADRLRAMTALHGKIKEMIGKLEQK